MSLQILNPSHEEVVEVTELADRLPDLSGVTVGIISNGKQGTRPFFDALEAELRARGVGEVERVTKPNYSAPAGDDILDRAKQWNALVAGIGD